MKTGKVGFIGGGQMAGALIAGAIQAKVFDASQIVVIESLDSRLEQLAKLFPGVTLGKVFDAAVDCDQLIIALKPQILREVGKSLGASLSGDRLWVSIAAGVSLSELSGQLGTKRIVRVMPNTPAQVGEGAAAICSLSEVGSADLQWVQSLMESVGNCVRVKESQMHAVTGISGSSPAYIYTIIEAMADGGVLGGLPRDVALKLAAQSVLGAAKMVLQSGLHPGQLKDQVTSPAGTTIAALRELEAAGVRSAMIEAVQAATIRSQELESES